MARTSLRHQLWCTPAARLAQVLVCCFRRTLQDQEEALEANSGDRHMLQTMEDGCTPSNISSYDAGNCSRFEV